MRIVFISKKLVIYCLSSLAFFLALSPLILHSKMSSETAEYWKNSKDIIWNVATSEKVIAITFDDGPDKIYTPQVLKILKAKNVQATFFVVGEQVEKYPDLTRQIINDSHELANHTYTHPTLQGVSLKKLEQEIQATKSIIEKTTKTKVTLFRPPGGYYNKTIVTLAKNNGYKTIIWSWSQDTNDWANPGVKYIVNKVLKNAQSGDIIIFHDSGGNREQTIKALIPVIDGLKEKGFNFVSVSALLKKEDKNIKVLSPPTSNKFYE